MKCPICQHNDIETIYEDYIRDGAAGNLTNNKYIMYQCKECLVIWHDIKENNIDKFYESSEYRMRMENNADFEFYSEHHDTEVLEKLEYTGTGLFRNRVVADIGCGGGSFLDFLSGVASEIIAIEPSEIYQKGLSKKGYKVYSYAKLALNNYKNKIDIVTSFDVIEHVENPLLFMQEIYGLLGDGGCAIIGTPSDAPIMRKLLGKVYEKFLFNYQHPWVFSQKNFELICYKAGFKHVKIEQKQRYGISNFITWLNEKQPKGHVEFDFISETMDNTWKRELESMCVADYLVVYLQK